MEIKEGEIVFSVFSEHPIIDFRQAEPSHFDISAIGTNAEPDFRKDQAFDHYSYCEALMRKLLDINLTDCKEFLEYHSKKLKDPKSWLKQVEILIDQNNHIFYKESCRYAKLSLFLNSLIDKFETSKEKTPQFDYWELKKRVDNIELDEEKRKVLIDERFNYLIHNVHNDNVLQDKFIKLIDLELAKITELQAFSGQKKSQTNNLTIPERPNKLKMNCNINVIVNVFYQLTNELDSSGKTCITASKTEVADAICAIFVDKNGDELVNDTVYTILSPGKYEKRPKSHKQVKIAID